MELGAEARIRQWDTFRRNNLIGTVGNTSFEIQASGADDSVIFSSMILNSS